MADLIRQWLGLEDGQDLIEYALLAATIAIALVIAMQMVRTALSSEFSTIAQSVTGT
jgi:Flp pilus assembly pilin Flp